MAICHVLQIFSILNIALLSYLIQAIFLRKHKSCHNDTIVSPPGFTNATTNIEYVHICRLNMIYNFPTGIFHIYTFHLWDRFVDSIPPNPTSYGNNMKCSFYVSTAFLLNVLSSTYCKFISHWLTLLCIYSLNTKEYSRCLVRWFNLIFLTDEQPVKFQFS